MGGGRRKRTGTDSRRSTASQTAIPPRDFALRRPATVETPCRLDGRSHGISAKLAHLHAEGQLSTVELAGATKGAERAGRIESAEALLATVEHDFRTQVQLIRLEPERVLPQARGLVLQHRLRALEAIHIAVAVELRRSEGPDVIFVTRSVDQTAAAKAHGFPLL